MFFRGTGPIWSHQAEEYEEFSFDGCALRQGFKMGLTLQAGIQAIWDLITPGYIHGTCWCFPPPSAWRIARMNIQQQSFMHRLLSRVLCNHRKRWSCKEKKVQNVLQICHFPPHFPKKARRTRCAQMSTYSLAHLKDNSRFREASFTPAEIAAFEAFPEASESHCSDLLIFYTFSWIILKGFFIRNGKPTKSVQNLN